MGVGGWVGVFASVCVCARPANSQREIGARFWNSTTRKQLKTFYTAPDCWKLNGNDILNKYFYASYSVFLLTARKKKKKNTNKHIKQPIALAYLSLSTGTQQS